MPEADDFPNNNLLISQGDLPYSCISSAPVSGALDYGILYNVGLCLKTLPESARQVFSYGFHVLSFVKLRAA